MGLHRIANVSQALRLICHVKPCQEDFVVCFASVFFYTSSLNGGKDQVSHFRPERQPSKITMASSGFGAVFNSASICQSLKFSLKLLPNPV